MKPLLTYQIHEKFPYKEMTFKISKQDGIKFFEGQVRYHNRMSSKVLYKMKLQGSEQLQTVLAMYNRELNRYKVTPSFQRLRTMVREHIDQMISPE